MDILFNTFAAKYKRTNLDFIRSINDQILWDAPLIGIRGARGVGKTTLLLQHIKKNFKIDGSVLYASADNIWFNEHGIYALATDFAKRGGKYLFLDEVHKYPNWSQELKNIYDDLPDLHVVFTGSSLLEILNSRADLSRRASVYDMQGFSFREYLNWTEQTKVAPISLEQLLENHLEIATNIASKTTILKLFEDYLRHGYYPFYKEQPTLYYSRLSEIINLILDIELPLLRNVDITYVPKVKQLLYIIAESAPFVPNISKLSERIGASRAALTTYIEALHESRITFNLQKYTSGIARLQKPEKIYLDNTNLSFALAGGKSDIGNLRETFFANQLRHTNKITMADAGDFVVNDTYTFEIGGAGKQRKQITGINKAFVVADNIEYGSPGKIPLWMFGMLY